MAIENVKINYEKIINGLAAQFNSLSSTLEIGAVTDTETAKIYDSVKNLSVFIEDEQTFLRRDELKPNNIHIVVKFGRATVNFGSSVLQLSLIVFGTENKIKPVQNLLSAYVSEFNLKYLNNDSNSFQIWTTPTVNSNFISSGNSFRSLLTLNGTLVIGREMVKLGTLTYQWQGGSEEIPFIAFNDNFSNAVSPQPFGDTFGFVKSEVNLSTYSFSISTYNMDCKLMRDIQAIKGFRYVGIESGKASTKAPNDSFTFLFNFDNGYTNDYLPSASDPITQSNFTKTFKLKDVTFSQKIGDIPSITMSFTH